MQQDNNCKNGCNLEYPRPPHIGISSPQGDANVIFRMLFEQQKKAPVESYNVKLIDYRSKVPNYNTVVVELRAHCNNFSIDLINIGIKKIIVTYNEAAEEPEIIFES